MDPAKVGADTIAAQLRLAPDVFGANKEWMPQYADLALQIAGNSLPELLRQQGTANTTQRSADINDVLNLAPQALAAWRAANPGVSSSQDRLSGAIDAAGNRAAPQIGRYTAGAPRLGPAGQAQASPLMGGLEANAAAGLGQVSPLQLELQRQAMEQLGGELSPAQLAKVQQDTRGAYAARGLYDSNQAIGAEILNTDAARAQRRAAAQQFAMGVDQAGQGQLQANRGFAGDVANLRTSANQFNTGQQNQFGLARYGTQAGLNQFNAGQLANIDQVNAQLGLSNQQQNIANLFNLAQQYAATSQDPYQLVLGRSGAPATAGALAQNAGPTMFDPFNSAITSMYAGNQANQQAAAVAGANNAAAQNAGTMQMGSSALMAMMMMCWVARAAYGEENPRWLEFRRYVLRRAPRRFFELYLRQGPAAGRRVAADPGLAARVRELMDRILSASDSQLSTLEVSHAC